MFVVGVTPAAHPAGFMLGDAIEILTSSESSESAYLRTVIGEREERRMNLINRL